MFPSQLPQHLFTLTFLSFVVLTAASSALAATISDDFSDGDFTSGPVIWTVEAADFQVESGYLSADVDGNDRSRSIATTLDTAATAFDLSMEYRSQFPGSGNMFWRLEVLDAAGQGYQLEFRDNAVYGSPARGFILYARDSSAATSEITLGSSTAAANNTDVFKTIRFAYSQSTGKLKVWNDDNSGSPVLEIDISDSITDYFPTFSGFSQIRLFANTTSGGTGEESHWDDFSMTYTPVPEPATAMVLVIGGVLLCAGRYRHPFQR